MGLSWGLNEHGEESTLERAVLLYREGTVPIVRKLKGEWGGGGFDKC